MTRDEQLREKFLADPHNAYAVEHRPIHAALMWHQFKAGANAAMDLQFEPGAVRFGEADLTDAQKLSVAFTGLDMNTPPLPMRNFAQQYVPPPPHDLGGES